MPSIFDKKSSDLPVQSRGHEDWQPPHRGAKRCVTRPLQAGRQRVELNGAFRPGWLSLLATRLAALGVSIDSAHATRREDGQWCATIDVWSLRPLDLDKIPYIDLAERDGQISAMPLVLESFSVDVAPHNDGWLELQVEAEDSLGFLGRLLSALALVVLFPVELRIATQDGRARDRIVLGGINAGKVSSVALGMVRELMKRAGTPSEKR